MVDQVEEMRLRRPGTFGDMHQVVAPLPASKGKVLQLPGTFSEEVQEKHAKIPIYKEALAVITFPSCPQAGALMRPSAVNKAPRLEAAWIARYVYTYIHICTDEAT